MILLACKILCQYIVYHIQYMYACLPASLWLVNLLMNVDAMPPCFSVRQIHVHYRFAVWNAKSVK